MSQESRIRPGQFAELSPHLSIREVAQYWSDETGEAPKTIERLLMDNFAHKGSRFVPVFPDVTLTREELLSWCEETGISPPKFWGKKSAINAADRGRRDADCRSWLKELAEEERQNTKAQYRDEAIRKYGVSGRGFDQIWAQTVPNSWKTPGRPKGSRGRD